MGGAGLLIQGVHTLGSNKSHLCAALVACPSCQTQMKWILFVTVLRNIICLCYGVSGWCVASRGCSATL